MDATGSSKRNKGRESRTLLNVNGRIEFKRIRYQSVDKGSEHPIDELVDDAMETAVSVGLRELCCELGIAGRSFARSAKSLKDAAQIGMSEEMLRQVIESEGKAVLKASATEQLELDWSASECKTRNPQGEQVSRIYVSVDGVTVPVTTAVEKNKCRETVLAKRKAMPVEKRKGLVPLRCVKKGSDQRFKQVYVTILYDQDKTHRLVGVTRQDHRGLGKLLKREAARVKLRGAVERVGLVDGAVCLRRHLEDLPLELILLDFYHLSEHTNDGSRKTLGEKTEAGKQWVQEVLHAARHEGYAPFFQKLLDWRSGLRGNKRKEADRLLNYVAERQEMIAYDLCDQRGWDVGTGPMESMCGVTTDRIKGRGRRWDIDHAEEVMALEAMYQSNLWDKYWANALCNRN